MVAAVDILPATASRYFASGISFDMGFCISRSLQPYLRSAHRHLKSATRTQLHQYIQAQWAREWEDETKGRTTHALTPTPTRTVLRLHSSFHRPLSIGCPCRIGRWVP